jgi:hypothetical protein
MDSITDTDRGTVPDTKPEIIAITINKNQETVINKLSCNKVKGLPLQRRQLCS